MFIVICPNGEPKELGESPWWYFFGPFENMHKAGDWLEEHLCKFNAKNEHTIVSVTPALKNRMPIL